MQKNDIWSELREKLPYETTPQQTQRRRKIWEAFDVNRNGYLSLAEVDKGVTDVLHLPALFNLKPVLIQAFSSAKNKLKSKNAHGDDYVSQAEFRYLLMYLRQYYQYWVAFDLIDTDDDRRISFNQFKQASQMMAKWGIKGNPQALFKQADRDGGGMIVFHQFCQWAIKKSLDIDTDDDAL